jgi:bifunctional non-homologous end joining protein LigD
MAKGAMGRHAGLSEYAGKRDFTVTAEPPAARPRRSGSRTRQFVVQKHAARRLHYDFRLELDGTLKSWAVPKGPSLDPAVKRLAVHVEDHPLAYAAFEGHIPEGEYGGGDVIVWDRGDWQADDADPAAAYRDGKLKFHLLGEKLSGGWTLVRTHLKGSGDKEQWLLIKEKDAVARADYDITLERPESVITHATLPGEKAPKRAKSAKAAKAPRKAGEAPAGARRAPLPETLAPQLATLVDRPPAGDWHYEVKFDGYRLLARIDGKKVKLLTRNGLDWTAKLPEIAAAVTKLGVESAWLDGEIIVPDAEGRSDFQALQNAFDENRSGRIVYYVFDLVYHDELDLRATPLETRRARLRQLCAAKASAPLAYSEDIAGLEARGADLLARACAMKLEGLIGKRADSLYASRRSGDWIKLKCRQLQEFVVGGLTTPRGSRSGFGALLLGVHDSGESDGKLVYAGRVGTGFTQATLSALAAKMRPLARAKPPFAKPPSGGEAAGVTWLAPKLVCEVGFAGWTKEGIVRQAVFHGLREDKPARSVVRESAQPANEAVAASVSRSRGKARSEAATVSGIAVSHPDRVIDVESGTTKLALAEYYRDVADRLLTMLAGRPVAIVRAPTGVAGEKFFQRHVQTLAFPGLKAVDADGEAAMEIESLPALVGAVQMGAIEFHTWNASGRRLDRPDRMIFDLDPDPALPWSATVEATRLVLTLLHELGLAAFLKTSGGKGMHVVVPLARGHDWDFVKDFSHAVTSHLARLMPDRFSGRMGPKNRVGRIFVDYLRNQKGGTTVAAYSARARPGLPVSVPIALAELDKVSGGAQWTVRSLPQRLRALKAEPWAGFAETAQSLSGR